MTPTDLVLASLVIAIGACLQGTIGFGLGVFSAPLLVLIEPSLVPGPLLLIGTTVMVVLLAKERASFDLRGTGWALAGRLPGSLVGGLLVLVLSTKVLALMLAGMVLMGAVTTARGWAPPPSRRNLVVAGVTSGVMGTATSVGAPPMALVWQSSEGPALRASMSGFLLVGSLISLGSLTLFGALDVDAVTTAARLFPALIVGYGVSLALVGRVERQSLRRTAIGVSILGASALIGQQLF